MKIGGIQKFSLVDYPGLVSAVLFTTGCNMRCGYCHNPELVVPELYSESLDLNEVYAFLDSRRDKLEGVVITGGEPTLRKDLPDMVKKIKSMGYQLKLDSNGTHPDVLKSFEVDLRPDNMGPHFATPVFKGEMKDEKFKKYQFEEHRKN